MAGFIHRRLQFLQCELLRFGIAAMGQHGARGKHFDMVCAVMRQQANFLPDLPGAVGFSVMEIPRQLNVRRQPGHRAGAAGNGDVSSATNMRGPMMSPRLMASRKATSFSARYTPTSRTVVNPASSVTRAFGTDSRTTREALFVNCEMGSPPPRAPPARCVWQSIKPGSTVIFERSMTAAPEGIASPRPTASILPARIRIT